MRSDKSQLVICDCPEGGQDFVKEAVLYFCEYFERKQSFYSSFPEIALILNGECADEIKIPLKHKGDVIRYNEWERDGRVPIFRLIPFFEEDGSLGKGQDEDEFPGLPLFISGRWKQNVEILKRDGRGIYYNDFYEFEGGIEFLTENYKIF